MVLTLLFGLQLPCFPPLAFIHFLFNLGSLASGVLHDGFSFVGPDTPLVPLLDFGTEVEDKL